MKQVKITMAFAGKQDVSITIVAQTDNEAINIASTQFPDAVLFML